MLALCSFLFGERVPTFKFILHLDIAATTCSNQLSLSHGGEGRTSHGFFRIIMLRFFPNWQLSLISVGASQYHKICKNTNATEYCTYLWIGVKYNGWN